MELEFAKFSLKNLIMRRNSERRGFSHPELCKICVDLLENLYGLFENNIAHFDVKPDNILYLELNECFILADYGVSSTL